jgi:hypothetical protein
MSCWGSLIRSPGAEAVPLAFDIESVDVASNPGYTDMARRYCSFGQGIETKVMTRWKSMAAPSSEKVGSRPTSTQAIAITSEFAGRLPWPPFLAA